MAPVTRLESRSKSRSKAKYCSFLGLPPELRNLIYHHLFFVPATEGKSSFVHQVVRSKAESPKANGILAMLQTCKLIYQEAKTIFYSINDLKLRPRMITQATLARLGKRRFEAIDTITVCTEWYDTIHFPDLVRVLASLCNLKTVTVKLYARLRWAREEAVNLLKDFAASSHNIEALDLVFSPCPGVEELRRRAQAEIDEVIRKRKAGLVKG